MISFTCDYNEGAHPEILRRLVESNMEQHAGYGDDIYTQSAIAKIRQAVGRQAADVFLLVGGTQTNATVIDGMLRHHEAVIAVSTGHIAVHESGAVELSGHKVITIDGCSGKMTAEALRSHLATFFGDPTWQHMAIPEMVYISFPTEYGTIYTRQELTEIRRVCDDYGMLLFVDGARLGYGLACDEADITMEDLSQLCDVFYIGGTKIGALCGEAVVFPNRNAPRNFFSIVKQHGALLAKGRLLGLQFDTLFTDNLYLDISRNAIDKAMKLKSVFQKHGIPFYIDSPTNQQFPILSQQQADSLAGEIAFETWEKLPDGRAVTRFATSWATTDGDVDRLDELMRHC